MTYEWLLTSDEASDKLFLGQLYLLYIYFRLKCKLRIQCVAWKSITNVL